MIGHHTGAERGARSRVSGHGLDPDTLDAQRGDMSRRLHAALNRVLPATMRQRLRDMASAFIPTMRHLDMWARLQHVARLGMNPDVIYDIGAAQGAWAQRAATIWPNARIIGFEPNESRVPELEATRASANPSTPA